MNSQPVDDSCAEAEDEIERLMKLAKDAYSAWESDRDARVGKILTAMLDSEFCEIYRPDLSKDAEKIDTSARQVAEIERLTKRVEIHCHEIYAARAAKDNAVRLLTDIHALLYPPRIEDKSGTVFGFRFPGNANEILQELSDRIRALPDEINKLGDSPKLAGHDVSAPGSDESKS